MAEGRGHWGRIQVQHVKLVMNHAVLSQKREIGGKTVRRELAHQLIVLERGFQNTFKSYHFLDCLKSARKYQKNSIKISLCFWIMLIVLTSMIYSSSITNYEDFVADYTIDRKASNETISSYSNSFQKKTEALNTPRFFIENRGQLARDDIRYYYNGDYGIGFISSGILIGDPFDYSYSGNDHLGYSNQLNPIPMRITFEGSNYVEPEAADPLPHLTNFFLGNDQSHWYTDVPSYERIIYREVWDNIDIEYVGCNSTVKYNIYVKPGGKVDDISIYIDSSLSLNEDQKEMILHSSTGLLKDTNLVAYQLSDGQKIEIPLEFELHSPNSFGFNCIDDYNQSDVLIIDPMLIYSTYITTSVDDWVWGSTIDSSNNVYIVGTKESGPKGGKDAFVFKLNTAGSGLVYSTYIGGSTYDSGEDIVVDSSGNAYITGMTDSTNFPLKDAADSTHDNSDEAFIVKLDTKGDIVFSTYLGGSGSDGGYAIAIDSNTVPSPYIAGVTESNNLPEKKNTYAGSTDYFVARIDDQGEDIDYTRYIGGSSNEGASTAMHWLSIDVDINDKAYVTGRTRSPDFPTTANCYQSGKKGTYDAFLTKVKSDGSGLDFSTYLGGSSSEAGCCVVVDQNNFPYVIGNTDSNDFPMKNAYDTTFNGGDDVFVTKFTKDGQDVVFSTYIGGTGGDYGSGLAIGSGFRIYLTGSTDSTDFPNTTGAYSITKQSGTDVFALVLEYDGSEILYSTFVGGNNSDGRVGYGCDIACDSKGNAYVAGQTLSNDFPTTQGSYQEDGLGNREGFIFKIDMIFPQFDNIQCSTLATTGDSFSFSVATSDNNGINKVEVEYWYGDGQHNITTIPLGTPNPYPYSLTMNINHTLDTFNYILRAVDSYGNFLETDVTALQVLDNDSPTIDVDHTLGSGTTGDDFTFNVTASDNIEIDLVYVEYWFGTGDATNVSMGTNTPYVKNITIPSDSTEFLHYIIRVRDTSGRWTIANQKDVTILDNDRPIFGKDTSDSTGTTGDSFSFSITIEDNIGVQSANLEYWFGMGAHTVQPFSSMGPFAFQVPLPLDSLDSLHYFFSASDSAGNSNQTPQMVITIIDDEIPFFGEDSSDLVAYLGKSYRFNIPVSDNIGVTNVYIEYWYGDGSHENRTMTNHEGDYFYTIDIPQFQLEYLSYFISASDAAGNWNSTISRVVNHDPIIDDVYAPTIFDLTPVNESSLINRRPTISANYTDEATGNTGINSVVLMVDDTDVTIQAAVTNNSIVYTPSSDLSVGTHTVELSVRDGSPHSNLATVVWTFIIKPQLGQEVNRITISPTDVTIPVGGSQDFTVKLLDKDGNVVTGYSVAWKVVGDIGTIEAGSFSATKMGTGKVSVSFLTLTAEANVTVMEEIEVSRIEISPDQAILIVGGKQQFQALCYNAEDDLIPGISCSWVVISNIGTIVDGLFSAKEVGTGKVRVSYGTLQAEAAVTVVKESDIIRIEISPIDVIFKKGKTGQFECTFFDINDKPISNKQCLWTVEGDIGSIDTSGLFTATAVGMGKVKATFGALIAEVDITVTSFPDIEIVSVIQKEHTIVISLNFSDNVPMGTTCFIIMESGDWMATTLTMAGIIEYDAENLVPGPHSLKVKLTKGLDESISPEVYFTWENVPDKTPYTNILLWVAIILIVVLIIITVIFVLGRMRNL